MPSKENKRQLYLASNMGELQKLTDVKQTSTSNARILVKSADKMFQEADKCFDSGDEERAFVLYMRFFNIIKQVKTTADYKKNKQYYDNLIGQKNQIRAIENAEKLAESLKERYDFREAEAVAKKFAALDTNRSGKAEKAEEEEEKEKKEEEKTEKKSAESAEANGESSKESTPQPSVTPTSLYELFHDQSAQLILMDARPQADFTESHINKPFCISVPQEILPPGTTVTQMENRLPEGSRDLWRQRGNVDHIVLVDWNSKLESLTIGSTLRTLKDALFKYDSTVIIKSEPLVLEGGYEQWLLYYPMYTTNPKVSRQSGPETAATSSITSLDFDYPDFDDKPPEPEIKSAPAANDALADSLAEFVKGDTAKPASPAGATPVFDRSLKPKGSGGSLTDILSKSTGMNNSRNVNLAASDSRSSEGISIVSNSLYPSVAYTRRPEKNTNIYNDTARAGGASESAGARPSTSAAAGNRDVSQHPPPPSTAGTSRQDEEERSRLQEEQLKLQELEEKRHKEEKALADLMRKRRHLEEQMKDSERTEREMQEEKVQAAREKEEQARQRLAEVERLRQERKRKEMEAEREKQDNLAKERALEEARERARREEEEKEIARLKAEEHAERLRQEQEEKTRQEAAAAARQKDEEDKARQRKAEDEQAAAKQKQEEDERKMKEVEENARKEEQRKREMERKEKERAEAARREEEARKARQAEEERRRQLEEQKRRQEEEERKRKADEQRRKLEEERRIAAEKERVASDENLRRAQENKMVPAPSLPTGWEKRLDRGTNRYYYIDHNRSVTQWEPPHMTKLIQPPSEGKSGTYITRLKEEPAMPSRGLTRSHSSPDIVKQLADEARAKKPAFSKGPEPAARKPVKHYVLRRDLNPVYGNVGPALCGLRNLGNTCYMNSTVQCLNNTTPLISYFLNDTYQEDVNRDSVEGMNGEVVDDFAVVVKALWSGQYRCITPRDLKTTVGKYNPMFAGYQQQDSQEFLTFLLDGLHEGLNEVKVRPQIPDQDNDRLPDEQAARIAWENHKRLHRSIIVELFQGQLKSTLTCRTCRKMSVTFQAFMYISLPIPSSSRCTLRDCFRAFLQPEMMTGSCKWKCPQCKVERDAEKKIDIWKFPHILLIGLNRFVSDGMWMQKKTTYVDFPVNDVDLSEYMIGPKNRSRYSLYGVSNHYGTMEGGHYTAYCRNPCSSKWYKFDDHEVYEMSRSDVKTNAAFVLYYTSIELKAPQFKPQW